MLKKRNTFLLLLVFFGIHTLYGQNCSYTISPSTHHNWIDVVAQKKTVSVGLGSDTTILRNSDKLIIASEPLDATDDWATRTFIKFDLYANEENSCGWKEAYLHLKFTGAQADSHKTTSGSNSFVISRVIDDWGDDTLRWKNPPPTNPFRMPRTTTTDQITVTGSTTGDEDFKVNIVDFFNYWRENEGTNFGIEIRLVDESGTRGLNFTSSEFGSPLVHPYIEATTKSCSRNQSNAGSDQVICNGQSTQLEGRYGEFFEWEADPTLSSRFIANPTVNPTTTTTYVLKTVLGGCESKDEVTVRVDDYPTLTMSPDQEICYGDTVQISASGATRYSWTPKSYNLGPNDPNPNVYPLTNTTYYVAADNNSDCKTIDSVRIVVRPLANTNAGKDVTICEGDTAFLVASGATTYEWIKNTTGLSATNINNPEATPKTDITYTVKGDNGFCPVEDEITVTVIPKFVVDAGEDQEMCFGDETVKLGAQTGFPFYRWSPSNVLSDASKPNPSVINLQTTTTFELTVADANQCTAKDEVTITVNPLPEIVLGRDTFVCLNESIDAEIISISSGDFTYHWDESFGLNDLSDTAALNITINGVADTILTYGLTITDVKGCEAYDDFVITTLPTLEVDVFGDDSTICSGSIVEIGVIGGLTFDWEEEEGILSLARDRNTLKVNPTKPTTYQVKVTNGEKCGETTAFINLDVIQNPEVYAKLPKSVREQDTVFVCKGREEELQAVGAEQYIWSTGDTSETIQYRLLTDNNVLTVYGISQGCRGPADEILIKINPNDTCFSAVYVPNAFNPFSPIEENRVFTIYPFLIRDYQIKIFDRWGRKVFETDDQKEYWDGTIEGTLVPEGTYYYVIEAFGTDEESRSTNGTVHVKY